jgi:hypothetical protein
MPTLSVQRTGLTAHVANFLALASLMILTGAGYCTQVKPDNQMVSLSYTLV